MRFRLKADFLTFAREQIRGGLWYKVRSGLLSRVVCCGSRNRKNADDRFFLRHLD